MTQMHFKVPNRPKIHSCCEYASVRIFVTDGRDGTPPIMSFSITSSSSHHSFELFLNRLDLFHPSHHNFYDQFILVYTQRYWSKANAWSQWKHVCDWSDCGGSLVFIPLKVNFITTMSEETEPINEIH